MRSARDGAVAQLGEHHVRNVGVEGSNPFCSTIPLASLAWLVAPEGLLAGGLAAFGRLDLGAIPPKLRV